MINHQSLNIEVRPETDSDHLAIHRINELAFGRPQEADIVDKLRDSCPEFLSLVAAMGGQVVGHILFTPITIEGSDRTGGMALGPLAVMPEIQKQGIGSRLTIEGLEILRRAGCPYVIVLGHPEYYPRFGFVPASKFGLVSQWESVPDEAFMALELIPGALAGVSGVARYRAEFDEVS
ncbi:MAG: N-acetyltransferase [Anaerolineales bacterium]|nr:N-acetyltransferase [Anaerolineales bacterium]